MKDRDQGERDGTDRSYKAVEAAKPELLSLRNKPPLFLLSSLSSTEGFPYPGPFLANSLPEEALYSAGPLFSSYKYFCILQIINPRNVNRQIKLHNMIS